MTHSHLKVKKSIDKNKKKCESLNPNKECYQDILIDNVKTKIKKLNILKKAKKSNNYSININNHNFNNNINVFNPNLLMKPAIKSSFKQNNINPDLKNFLL